MISPLIYVTIHYITTRLKRQDIKRKILKRFSPPAGANFAVSKIKKALQKMQGLYIKKSNLLIFWNS
jgi:hypothetical protein